MEHRYPIKALLYVTNKLLFVHLSKKNLLLRHSDESWIRVLFVNDRPGAQFLCRLLPKSRKCNFEALRSRKSRPACLLCPWEMHLTGIYHLYGRDRWWGRAAYPSWWPILIKNMQSISSYTTMNKKCRPTAQVL